MTRQTADILAAFDALCNVACTLLLITGYIMIRRGRVKTHAACMISAVVFSLAFISGYLTLHYHIGTTHFPDLGWVRHAYLGLLATHTILAATVPFLVGITLYRALRFRFTRHKAIARWTLPIWVYVSVTGVVIYWMLYHLAPAMTGR
jgi:uncharacterized membrane protein YozB (DUF420 family)